MARYRERGRYSKIPLGEAFVTRYRREAVMARYLYEKKSWRDTGREAVTAIYRRRGSQGRVPNIL